MRPLNLLMNQKNNLNNFFPLKVAIYSVLGFFTIYILFGLDGWGDRASNENAVGQVSRWCERVSDGLLREPSNTLGNLGFIFVAFTCFINFLKMQRLKKELLCLVLLVLR